MTAKVKTFARHKARRFLVQAFYQWQLSDNDIIDIEQQFMARDDIAKIDVLYFKELLYKIPQQVTELEAVFAPFLDRKVSELDPVSLAILRIAAYELLHRIDIPYQVVINEAVELAKVFGADESFKYINGVLDKLAQKLRTTELNTRK